jgi:hypothetical protein
MSVSIDPWTTDSEAMRYVTHSAVFIKVCTIYSQFLWAFFFLRSLLSCGSMLPVFSGPFSCVKNRS